MSLSDGAHDFLGIRFYGPPAFVATASVILAVAFIANAIWIFRDAKEREKNPWIAVIFLAGSGWPLSNVFGCAPSGKYRGAQFLPIR